MKRFAAGLAVVCALGGAGFMLAQDDVETLRVDVDLVNVFFSVRSKQGLIGNLTKDDFTVFEEGKEQQIRNFTRESDLPLTIGLLVDTSKSMENLIEVEKHAAGKFFTSVLREKDMAFIIGFGPEAELMQDYTNSQTLLRKALGELKITAPLPTGGIGGPNPGPFPTSSRGKGTVLYDAISLASTEKLRREVGRKALILITDGVDSGSTYSLKDAIEAAQKADAIVYSIYYNDPYYTYMGGSGWGELKRMSEETGGRAFEIKRKQNLEEIFAQIQEEMRTQYAVAYTPANPARDGTFRRIEIKPKNKDHKVQARKGYYAMPPEA